MLEGSDGAAAGLRLGAYIPSCDGDPEVLLLGTGSELQLAVGAAQRLRAEGRRVRVVSVPSLDRFLGADTSAQEAVVPSSVRRRVAVEAGSTLGWAAVVGEAGTVIGIDRFGASAPAADLATHFGFTVDAVYAAAADQLARS